MVSFQVYTKRSEVQAKTATLYKRVRPSESLGEKSCEIKFRKVAAISMMITSNNHEVIFKM